MMKKRSWKRGAAVLAVVLMLGSAIGLSGCGDSGKKEETKVGKAAGASGSSQQDEKGASGNDAGKEAVISDFEVKNLDGETLKKEDVLGKNRLNMVNVWATWCDPCRREIPDLQKLADKYADQGFGVVGILSDGVDLQNFDPEKENLVTLPDNIELAKEIMKESKAKYPVIIPNLSLIYEVVGGLQYYPTTFFTDQNGKLVGQVYSGVQKTSLLEEVIEDLLDELPQE